MYRKLLDIFTVDACVVYLKKACDSFGTEVLYNIVSEVSIPMKRIRLIKTYLKESKGKVSPYTCY